MKTHLLNRSLLALILSSSALVAASNELPAFQSCPANSCDPIVSGRISACPPASLSMPISDPVKVPGSLLAMPATAPIGVFTERDAGTPISIPLNGKFRVRLTTDSTVDPIGSFWTPANIGNQNMELKLVDRTNDHWFSEGSVRAKSTFLFAYQPLVVGQTELSFDLVQWGVVKKNDPANHPNYIIAGRPTGLMTQPVESVDVEKKVIRTITFPVTVLPSDCSSVQ